ncbi:hypothetical protein NEAUS04_1464 [Nematocida ausubeli]|nr:hypothetical protein NEAUS05_1642 [Nematocida ausubeli]KAI5163279.1 hypothetical protein NEAUS04_1464 [Nematocida ausubeli]
MVENIKGTSCFSMNMFASIQRLLLGKRKALTKTQRSAYHLSGFAHFQSILSCVGLESQAQARRAEQEYSFLIQEIEKEPHEKSHLFLLFSSFFAQVEALLSLAPKVSGAIRVIQEEAEDLLVHQMCMYVEKAATEDPPKEPAQIFTALFEKLPPKKASGIRIRYFSQRIQKIQKASKGLAPDDLVSAVDWECKKYASLFGVKDIMEDRVLVLDGFIYSFIRGSQGSSQKDLCHLRECVRTRAGTCKGAAFLLKRLNIKP